MFKLTKNLYTVLISMMSILCYQTYAMENQAQEIIAKSSSDYEMIEGDAEHYLSLLKKAILNSNNDQLLEFIKIASTPATVDDFLKQLSPVFIHLINEQVLQNIVDCRKGLETNTTEYKNWLYFISAMNNKNFQGASNHYMVLTEAQRVSNNRHILEFELYLRPFILQYQYKKNNLIVENQAALIETYKFIIAQNEREIRQLQDHQSTLEKQSTQKRGFEVLQKRHASSRDVTVPNKSPRISHPISPIIDLTTQLSPSAEYDSLLGISQISELSELGEDLYKELRPINEWMLLNSIAAKKIVLKAVKDRYGFNNLKEFLLDLKHKCQFNNNSQIVYKCCFCEDHSYRKISLLYLHVAVIHILKIINHVLLRSYHKKINQVLEKHFCHSCDIHYINKEHLMLHMIYKHYDYTCKEEKRYVCGCIPNHSFNRYNNFFVHMKGKMK